jgi:N-acetylneuraminic acid mutarotase
MTSRFRTVLLALLLTLPLTYGLSFAHPLTFEERVSAQEAIERVYFARQIGETRTFEQAMPREVLEAKVRTSLEQSAALEGQWGAPITGAMLRAETARMAGQTQMPDRLRELFAALGNDPFLVQEALARSVLADRLARNYFAFDSSIHAGTRREAEALGLALSEGRIDPRAAHPKRTVVEAADGEAAIGAVEEERESFVIRLPLEATDGSRRIAVYRASKERWDGWWARSRKNFDARSVETVAQEGDSQVAEAILQVDTQAAAPACVDNTWQAGFLDEIPDRTAPAVWTGSLMVTWGGSANDSRGWRYDPLTDTWSHMSTVNAPVGRLGHSLIWTGSRVIAWGGSGRADGGRYDPVTDAWSPMSTLNAPSGFTSHRAVWSGSSMLVWGTVMDQYNVNHLWAGARYDPATDTWSPISTANVPIPPNNAFTLVWAGGRMIAWGGRYNGVINTGGRYDPITNTWAPTSSVDAPTARESHGAISTGNQMIVWGGSGNGPAPWLNTGGRYDPVNDTWTPTSTTNAPSGRAGPSVAWADGEMVVWGGCNGNLYPCYMNNGGRYDPATDAWTSVSTSNAPALTGGEVMVAAGAQVLVWGGYANKTGGRYRLDTDSWLPISTGSAPTARYSHAAVWTGSRMVVWGGRADADSTSLTLPVAGGRYDPALASWSATSTVNAPSPREAFSTIWTGSLMIVWGGSDGAYVGTGGRYDPLADSWTPVSMTGAPAPRFAHTAVWTGSRMVVWGGKSSSGAVTNTGGRYDPQTDTWQATSTINAPLSRMEQTAVWTGSRMLVWGGNNQTIPYNTGGRYDPVDDSWSAMTTTGAPSARSFPGSAWTGRQMVISGGDSAGTGGRYDPVLDSWMPTSLGPFATRPTVWTGTRMIAWGGFSQSSPPEFFSARDTGGRYDPGTNTWTMTSMVDPPESRSGHTAVWTGDRMLVWGGYLYNTGGVYCGCAGGAVQTYYPDADGDGYGVASAAMPSCSPPPGYAAISGDCNDANGGISPGAAESCNGVDDNCSGTADEGLTVDNDGDGFSCSADCDDFAAGVHPGAAEICDKKDSNCDGLLPLNERDDDADGFAVCQGDCRDDLSAVHPGAPEGCDGLDTNCDGLVPVSERDADGDNWRPCQGDCDDGNPAGYPGAAEVCNGLDDDCDGGVDEGAGLDADGDGRPDCSDCQPTDPYTWAPPPEVTNLQAVSDQGDDYCLWDDLAPAAGVSVLYDVFGGSLTALRQNGGFSGGFCESSGLSFPAIAMPDEGPPGDGMYIMVRGRNSCGVGTYGSTHRDQTAGASALACP